jgi:asparagine synthase (glutamine-hydrolysing)
MCGIAGFASTSARSPEVARAVASTMADTLRHRGPDDSGAWASDDGRVALGHRRLSVVDLSPLGRNPMARSGGQCWITYNGEVYNYPAIRAELAHTGDRFVSQTDTEVILAAYERWGIDCVHRFVGMFAFGLWDAANDRLWLVRDRLGKKPLYYAEHAGTLWFASEIKALLAAGAFSPEIDPIAVQLYLRYGYVPAPYTIYRDVRKLPQGHHLIWEQGRSRVTRYWDPVLLATTDATRRPGVNPPSRPEEAVEELERRLAVAVRERLISDVPLGAFLSGGVDSSLIVALMQEATGRPVRTFTIRFENPEFDEADAAAAVARHLGTDHHEQTCGNREMVDIVERLPEMFDEPFADSSAIPTYLVSRVAREQVTVALSGDGGDELFFGYPRYRYCARASALLSLPAPLRRLGAAGASRLPTRRLRRIADVLRSDDADPYARFVTWFTAAEIATLTGTPPPEAPFYVDARGRMPPGSGSDAAGLLDVVSYLPDDILTKVDRASMAVSLEVRAPLLDHRVVEFALGLPVDLKWRHGETKWILRRLLYKRMPRHLIDRPKQGFGVPLDDWFRGPLSAPMNDCCRASDLEEMGINPDPVRGLWRSFQAGKSHRSDLLWQILMLVAWSRRRVARFPRHSTAAAAT